MSCYFRHLKEELAEAGITVTPQNKKAVDRAIHGLVEIDYKDCPRTWKAIKARIKSDPQARSDFIQAMRKIDVE